MSKAKRPLNQPLSPYDPRSRKMEFFGKMQRPQDREEQRREELRRRDLCSCGDPNCNYDFVRGAGRRSPSYSASEITSQNRSSDMASFERPEDIYRMMKREMEMRMMDRSFGYGPGPSPFSEPPKPKNTVPASYTEARDKIKDYILDVNHDTAWDDVIGNDVARAALVEAIEEPKLHPELYEFYGMKPPKGVLLFGPPGCGKTMFAKASAAAVGRVYGAKAEVLVVNGPQIQSPYVGVTEEKIRAIFKFAREYHAHHKHPLTVFFDEAEVLFPDRTGRTRKVAPWEESQVAQFLAEMDGLNSLGAFVILATNRPEAIDEALLRDGRCDRKIKVERPSKRAVEHILRKVLEGLPLKGKLDALVSAGVSEFFSTARVIHSSELLNKFVELASGREVHIDFRLEHIVSGAMVTSIARRAKSRAFARDREAKVKSGVITADIIGAVDEIFEENKRLEHAFAVREFFENLPLKEMLEPKGVVQ